MRLSVALSSCRRRLADLYRPAASRERRQLVAQDRGGARLVDVGAAAAAAGVEAATIET
jgi:hypothetical protein